MKEDILQIISEQFNVPMDELTEDVNLVNDLNADSIELVELIMTIEDNFDIEIEEDDLMDIETIKDIFELMDRYELA